ncbi:hypothetical protein [Antribacter gilvus]|uniref:hypothetical protein n=1 Tax=Antribacter gilvus TaxID=2304675 RepID=UPI000F7B87CB|nr:hypothetical protein [Antribacter gilvus]
MTGGTAGVAAPARRWDRVGDAVRSAVGSRTFLAVVVALYAAQAAWIALLARPSIYDETYHLYAATAFSDELLPFATQDADDHGVGDIERYPSYLYHYLASFPWRWFDHWDRDDRITLVRLVSVVVVALALVVWQRVIRAMGAGAASANVAVAAVSAAPTLVFLGGTVTNDVLLFLTTAWFTLAALRVYQSPTVDLGRWATLLLALGLVGVTKFSVLPYAAFVMAAVLVRQALLLRRLGRSGVSMPRPATRAARFRWALLVLGAVVGVALLVERFGVNLVVYGTPLPDCGQVHDVATCSQWLPWGRNLRLDASFPDLAVTPSLVVTFFSSVWLPRMIWLWNAIGVVGPGNVALTSAGPEVAGVVVLGGAFTLVAVLVLLLPLLGRENGPLMLLGGSLAFGVALFVVNLVDYRTLGQPVGVHGRYVLAVFPVLVGAATIAVSRALGGATLWKGLLVLLLTVAASQGGGAIAFLTQSTPDWWAHRPALVEVHERLAHVARVVVLEDDLVRDPRLNPSSP